MLKTNERYYNNFLAVFDVVITIALFATAYYLRVFTKAKSIIYSEQYLILALLIIPTWFILLKIINFQSSHKIKAYSIVIIEYVAAVTIGISVLYFFVFIFKLESISRLAMFGFALSNIITLSIVRILFISFQKRKILKGKYNSNIVLYADDSSISFINKLLESKHWGFNIIGVISNSEKIKNAYNNEFLVLPENTDINQLIEKREIDDIIYCKENFDKLEMTKLIYSCAEIGVNFQIQSDFFSLIASKSHINYFGEVPVLSISSTSTDDFALTIKKIIDYVLSFFVLIVFIPFFVIISILIKIESTGPVFFKQKRVGLRGRIFTMLKFRTMVNDAEKLKKKLENQNEVDGPVFKIKKDPRITKIGIFLRKTSLDEFPQFINVLIGDMSIVGPRPPIKNEVEQYERWQLRRLSMKPGITCIWQVSGRNQISFDEWMKLDLQYIDNWSLRLDIMLIIRTINVIFKRTGQ